MRWMRTVLAGVVAVTVLGAGSAGSVPLHPNTLKRMIDYDDLDEWVWIAEKAADRGIGVFPPTPPVISPERPRAALRILVLRVEFPDVPMQDRWTEKRLARILFKETQGGAMSVATFFAASSGSALTLSGEVEGVFMVPGLLGEYAGDQAGLGKYPSNAQKLVEDALTAAAGVRLEDFDAFGPGNRGDGVVDVVLVVHSGRGAEITGDKDDLWSHSGMLPRPFVRDGMRVDRYVLASAETGVGPLAHDVARLLGAPALYDPSYRWSGLGAWSLMGTGVWSGFSGGTLGALDAYSRILLGFTSPVDVEGDLRGVSLGCGNLPPPVFRLFPGGRPGPEYFLVECRRRFGFDQRLPAEGVLIYHVDERSEDERHPSCGPGMLHPRVTVEQADGLCELEAGLPADGGDLWARPETDRFSFYDFNEFSTPNSLTYEGGRTGVAVGNFRFDVGDLIADLSVNTEPDPSRTPEMTATWVEGGETSVVLIRLRVPRPGPVDLSVRGLRGKAVWHNRIEFDQAGDHQIRWDPSTAEAAGAGTYFVEAQTPYWWDVQRVVIP